jgi:hypothetical protein
MTKNPQRESANPSQPSKRQQVILDAVNKVIQTSLLIALDVGTSDCKCSVCQTAKKLLPNVRMLLDMGKVGKITKVP